jgi:hypothetical protein
MYGTLSFAELEAQHLELLPDRIVLSLFATVGGRGGTPGASGAGVAGSGSNSGNTFSNNPPGMFMQFNITSQGFNGTSGSNSHG